MAENTKDICLYFQIHQPYRINSVSPSKKPEWQDFFVGRKLGKRGQDMQNKAIFDKVALNCYLPTTKFWLEFLQKHPNFKFSLSFSGTFLEQCQQYPEYGQPVLELFQQFIKTNQVEILDETYYHSLAFLVDTKEYLEQIKLHRNLIKRLFNVEPKTFRNTELIYNNKIASIIQSLGYETILLEDAWWQPKPDLNQSFYTNQNQNLTPQELDLISNYKIQDKNSKLKIFFRNEKCSNGIMFVAKDPFVNGLLAQEIVVSKQNKIGIFTDYEFLGEHHESGDEATLNLEKQLNYLLQRRVNFKTIAEVSSTINPEKLESYNCPEFSSWGHKERDITVWRGGLQQEQAFLQLESLYWQIQASGRTNLLEAWRRLSTSCHFYFLGDKTGEDGEFVNLFSPYESISEALDIYLKVLYEIKQLL